METPSEIVALNTSSPATPSARHILHRLTLGFVFLTLALAGAGMAVTLFGKQTYRWRAFELEVSIQPAMMGRTRLIFAPLGEVRAHTHATPLHLIIGLHSVSFDDIKKLIAHPPPRAEIEEELERTARRNLNDFACKQILLGAIGGLFAPVLLHTRRLLGWLLATFIGGGFVTLTFFITLRTFDENAFRNPTYTGSLREAPWVIALAKDAFSKAEALSEKLRNVANNLSTLYGRIQAIPGYTSEEDTVSLLHISDLHNNPAAVDFILALADKFAVKAVIDTGDLTDFGTPLETNLSQGFAQLKIPYLFVAGNHDSQATVRAVRAHGNAILLQGKPVEVAGLVVLGTPDPSSAREGAGSVDTPLEALSAAGEQLVRAYHQTTPRPDIVCVHNPLQAAPLIGQAPLILCGHMHRAYVEEREGTVVCNAGTTGAAGARYFERKEGVAFSAAILTFVLHPSPRLLYIDQVTLDGSLGQYSINRRSFGEAGVP
jgi:predicted phosphodiesterase